MSFVKRLQDKNRIIALAFRENNASKMEKKPNWSTRVSKGFKIWG
jgi:hypothetical protein